MKLLAVWPLQQVDGLYDIDAQRECSQVSTELAGKEVLRIDVPLSGFEDVRRLDKNYAGHSDL